MKQIADYVRVVNPESDEKKITLEEMINDQGTGSIDRVRRNAYLKSKNIKPDGSYQLDLIFPVAIGSRPDMRHIPNDLARSALFTVKNKRVPRQNYQREKIFHYSDTVSITYTGIELRADDDELIWLQIVKYGQGIPLGEPFEFYLKDLVMDIGWLKNGRNYDRARECISRLKANELFCQNRHYGKSGAVSLILGYETYDDNDGKPVRYRVWIDKSIIVLFAGNTFTNLKWDTYRKLTPIARRLADYVASHQVPHPLSVEKFRQMCGSIDRSDRSWRQNVKSACQELQDAGIVSQASLNKAGQMTFLRQQTKGTYVPKRNYA
jgi:hypothetical protein